MKQLDGMLGYEWNYLLDGSLCESDIINEFVLCAKKFILYYFVIIKENMKYFCIFVNLLHSKEIILFLL